VQVVENRQLPSSKKFIRKHIGYKFDLTVQFFLRGGQDSKITTALFVAAHSFPYAYQKQTETVCVGPAPSSTG
jgi:hypothetical protein